MNTKLTVMLTFVLAVLASVAFAQQPGATSGAVVASEPGKAAVVRASEISAQVVGLEKSTRTVTLKGPQGNVVDLVAGADVKNFDQIKLGDMVVARYVEALTLELKTTKGPLGEPKVTEGAASAKTGERPGVVGAREVTVLAEVVAVEPAKSSISLKGPKGNVVALDVQNPDQFKVVKVGDQVEVTYTEALALSVEPAPKPADEKKK